MHITERLISQTGADRYINHILPRIGLFISRAILSTYAGFALHNRITNHSIQAQGTAALPHQTVDAIIKGARCPKSVGNDIRRMLRNNELPSRDFAPLADLYTRILNGTGLCSGLERDKMRATLEILTTCPDILPPVAAQIINRMEGHCEDNLLSLLDQTYYKAIATASIHRMGHQKIPDWNQWLGELRKMYHEHCFNITKISQPDPATP